MSVACSVPSLQWEGVGTLKLPVSPTGHCLNSKSPPTPTPRQSLQFRPALCPGGWGWGDGTVVLREQQVPGPLSLTWPPPLLRALCSSPVPSDPAG